MNEQLWCYVARASGLVGWGLLAASVLWGLAISTKSHGKRLRPNWMLDLHRFLGGAAVTFTALHVAGLVADSYVHFGPSEIFVPLASVWRPGPVAWGVVSLYLLTAIELTSLARKRISKRVWRTVHFSSFALFVTSTVHALTAGTDTVGPVFRITAATVSLVVVGLTIKRIAEARRRTAGAVKRPQRSPVPVRVHGLPAPTLAQRIDPGLAPPSRPRSPSSV